MNYKTIIYIILGLSIAHIGRAQKGLELGAWVGASQYFGDLQTEFAITDPGFAGGLNLRYNFDTRISFKTSLNYARLSASDADSQNTFERQRNLSFYSNTYDLTSQIEFNFLKYVHGSKDHFFTPYLFAGLSVFSFNPKTELNGEQFNLRLFGTEGQAIGEEYGRFSVATTLGMGLKWDLNYDWSMNVEFGIRNTYTDYIDDVSTTYPDLNALRALRGQQAVDLSDRSTGPGIGEFNRQRGNSRNKDNYAFFGVSIMRYFGTIPCPSVQK